DENDMEQIETVNADISRLSVAVRPMFHYGSSDRLDMYSGLRVGYKTLSAKHNSKDPVYDDLDTWNRSGFSFGLTAFGFRYYVSDNLGFNMEVSIGMPYAAGVG